MSVYIQLVPDRWPLLYLVQSKFCIESNFHTPRTAEAGSELDPAGCTGQVVALCHFKGRKATSAIGSAVYAGVGCRVNRAGPTKQGRTKGSTSKTGDLLPA